VGVTPPPTPLPRWKPAGPRWKAAEGAGKEDGRAAVEAVGDPAGVERGVGVWRDSLAGDLRAWRSRDSRRLNWKELP